MKTRIKIEKDKTHEIILTPIEVAIEDIENKVAKIRADMERKDKVMLELQLKSVVASVVNEGPLHIAETFLRLSLYIRVPWIVSCQSLHQNQFYT